jgi:hypothetical protein
MSFRRHVEAVKVLCLLLIIMVGVAAAQTSRGTIVGTVLDPTGAVVAGAKVTATETQTGEVRTATTNETGSFRIEAATPGIYTIEIAAGSFAPLKLEKLAVAGSVITPVTAKMTMGTTTETVTVVETGEQIQTESGELSKVITSQSVTQLPTPSQNPYQLAITLPGVTTVSSRDDFTNGTAFSVHGLRPRANNFLIDGFDNNDNAIQGQGLQPQNAEAVQQVTVLTNSYSAEFGRGGSSVSNVTYKSGSNSWHGGVWEQYQGSRLDALTTTQALDGLERVPQYVQNQFGFRLGGPIVKNKLFIFGTSQWARFFGAFQGSQLTVPTANGWATLQAVAAANPGTIANQIDTLFNTTSGIAAFPVGLSSTNIGTRAGCPLAAQNGAGNCLIERGRVTRFATAAAPSYEWTARADYVPNETNNFMVRFTSTRSSLSPDLFANPGSMPGFDTIQGGPARNFGAMWTHIFSPKVVNELRFSAQLINFTFDFGPEASANPLAFGPRLSVSGIYSGFGGVSGTFPQFRGHNVYVIQDAVAYTVGKHSLKIGADITHLEIKDGIPFNDRGSITYTSGGSCAGVGVATCSALANYIDNFAGPSGSINKQFGNPRINVPWTQQAYYVHDTWKLRSNLTLDFGMRWEYQPPDPSNVLPFPAWEEQALGTVSPQTFAIRIPQRPDKNNWAPRFGFAYTPHFAKWLFGDEKTVIRGGMGVFYDTFFTNINDNTAASSPNTLGGTIVNGVGRGTANATGVTGAVAPVLSPLNTITSVAAGLRNPMTYQWNFGFQREMPLGTVLEMAYVGTRGERLFANEQLNPFNHCFGLLGCTRLRPDLGSIVIRGNHADSVYHGLETSVYRSFKNGLQLRGAYTWSRAIDNMSEVFVTSGGASRRQDVFSYSGDRGPSVFNRTHRGVLSWVYEPPSVKGDSGGAKVLSWITRDWQFSGTASWTSGAPQTVFFSGFDQNGDGETANDRPIDGNHAVGIDYSDACFTSASVCSGVGEFDGVNYFDLFTGAPGTASDFRYILSDIFTDGNVGRNSYLNPGRWDTDWAVARRFRAPMGRLESSSFEIKAELFNVFNHPNRGLLGGVTGNVFSGDFLNIDSTQDGGRNIRLWAKWTF